MEWNKGIGIQFESWIWHRFVFVGVLADRRGVDIPIADLSHRPLRVANKTFLFSKKEFEREEAYSSIRNEHIFGLEVTEGGKEMLKLLGGLETTPDRFLVNALHAFFFSFDTNE